MRIDVGAVTGRNFADIKSATLQNIGRFMVNNTVEKDDAYQTNNGDELDEDLMEDSDSIEEDDDECAESRPLTPEEDKQNDDKKIMGYGKNQLNSTVRGAFTCKIVKKKAQDLGDGRVVAFGSTAARNDEMSNQQILERNKKIHKHYQGPYKKKKHISLFN